jgi:hypothetical protein
MGRPPIGKRAMSGAERMRRHRDKVSPRRPGMKPAVALRARLQARIRQLEIENAVLRTKLEKLHAESGRFMQAWAELWTVNKSRIHDLETELAGERARREAPLDVANLPKSYRKQFKIARRSLERAFKDRVRQEAHRLLDELFLAEAADSLDNVLEGRGPRVPKMTGYRDLRPVLSVARKGVRETEH